MLNLATYVHLHRCLRPTGVGKHIIEMCHNLRALDDVNMHLVTHTAYLDESKRPGVETTLQDFPLYALPGSRPWWELSWSLLDRPRIDRWLGDESWVYVPVEINVPTRRARLAVTIHCVNWFDPELPWYNEAGITSMRRRLWRMWKPMLDRAEVVFVVSEFLRQRVAELLHVPLERMVVVGNGVETRYLEVGHAPPPRPEGRDRPYLLTVGGLTDRKGGSELLNLMRVLAERMPDLELVVAGNNQANLAAEAERMSNVVSLGFVNAQERLPALMCHAEALAFMSRYDTFGIPALEGMACGTPVLVSHFAGQPEVVGDGGVVLDPTDTESIVSAITQVREDSSYRQDLADKGRARAAYWTWDRCARVVRDTLVNAG